MAGEFLVQDDGLLAEKSTHELARWYSERSETRESLSYEVHVMMTRAYTTLSAGPGPATRAGLSRARYNFLRVLYQAEEMRMLLSEIGQGLSAGRRQPFTHRRKCRPRRALLPPGRDASALLRQG